MNSTTKILNMSFYFNQYLQNMDKREQIRHSLWNSIIIFDSILISSFSIVITLTNYYPTWLTISFFTTIILSILLILYTYHTSYKNKTLEVYDNLSGLSTEINSLNEIIPNLNKEQIKNKMLKNNKIINFLEKVSIIFMFIGLLTLVTKLYHILDTTKCRDYHIINHFF